MTAPETGPQFIAVDAAHVAEVGPAAALLFARIQYRCNLHGEWRATRATLEAETGLSSAMLRTAVGVLRDREWVTAVRASQEDATLVWRVVYAGHADNAESAPPCGGIRHTPPAESAISSSKKSITPSSPQDDGALLPMPEKPRRTTKRATTLPDGFGPTQAHRDLAASLGVDLRVVGPAFVDHHTAKGSTFKDWNAALRTWIRNEARFAAEREARRTGAVAPLRQSDDDAFWASQGLPPMPKREMYG